MNKKILVYLTFSILILTGCLATPTKEVVLPSPLLTQTQTIDESYILTIATKDNGSSNVYDLLIGCFDTVPCIQKTTKLFDMSRVVRELSWSPHGNALAFSVGGGNSQDIFVTQDNGKTVKNITHSEEPDEYNPSWSPDGEKIAYLVGSAIEPSKIMTTTLDGETKQILSDVFEPSEFLWLEGGMTAYSALISRDDRNHQIQVLNQDGSLYWLILPSENKPDFDVHQIISLADKKHLVYGGSSENRSQFYLANLDTKTVQELSTVDKLCNDLSGSLSPDGKWLAFLSNCDSTDYHKYELHLVNLVNLQRVKFQGITVAGSILSIDWRPNHK